MLSAEQAEALILDLVQPLDSERDVETVDLLSAAGRILATEITSKLDFPHWDNSAMDGYAVRFADVQTCSAEKPVMLDIVEEIPAGYRPQHPVQAGQAARILTGSMMPPGADTVVIQEETKREGDRVIILSAPQPQAFIRTRGAFYRAGEPLLPARLLLSAPEIAVLAAAQCTQIKVYRRPRVAILSTGNELVSPEQPLKPGQIVDSNQYALASLVSQTGAEPILLGVVPDQPEALHKAIAHAITIADIVLSSGGVSVGDYDYVDQILIDLGAKIHIRSVAVKPGKPLTVATFAGSQEEGKGKRKSQAQHSTLNPQPFLSPPHSPILYFGLPGNPVSALVCFWRFVQPALRKLSGLPNSWSPKFVKGRSLQDLKSDGKRETYFWGQLHLMHGEFEFHLASGSQLSGNLINLAQTNGLALVPVGQTLIPAGEPIRVMSVGSPIIKNQKHG
jgi:molybdopterin molybdotransferase